ncbi:hypothetical protein KUTeg_006152 [Tegillarca granosa]|uniref:DNA polymerase epsilon catalytic subunit n=1 Tax=Tegillarca granosa TaxID=220873 RepID=A0ABQ9FK96_TEGGR|nr:hypothetical protein KUTeg_006152 [Tegillarca granosa]
MHFQPEIEMNWNIMHFLPEAAACQTNFSMIVAGYILSIYNHLQEEQQRMTPGNTPVKRRHESQSQVQFMAFHPIRSNNITQKISKKLSGNRNNIATEFPQPPGSYLPLNNPALEFVKSVCKVIALDSNVSIQITKLKRDLLKLIGIGEFSNDADFRDPCLSYVMPEVICKSCNHIRDLDLCRDPYLSHDGSG